LRAFGLLPGAIGVRRRAIAGAAALLPPVADYAAWYDLTDATTIAQNSDGTGAAAVGSPIGRVADKSPNGHHIFQATAANRPTLKEIAGKRSAWFQESHWLELPASLVLDRRASTVIACVRMNKGNGSANPTLLAMPKAAVQLGLNVTSDAKQGGEWRSMNNGASRDSNIDMNRAVDTVALVNGAAGGTIYAGAESAAIAVATAGTVAGGYLGRWDDTVSTTTTRLVGHAYELFFFTRALSAAEINQFRDYFTARHGATARTDDRFLVFEGDSITEGVGTSGFLTQRVDDFAYPSQLARALASQPKYTNLGEGGTKLEAMKATGNLTSQLLQNAAYGRRTVVVLAGTNDISSAFRMDGTTPQSAALILGDDNILLDSIRLADPGAFVAICTILPREPFNATQDQMVADVNAGRIANAAGYDLVIQTHAAPGLSNSADLSVYPDGIHPSDLGAGNLEGVVRLALQAAGRL
jgi:lysophospholipase L1-like esterase